MRRLAWVALTGAIAVALVGAWVASGIGRGGPELGPCAGDLGVDEEKGVRLTLSPAVVKRGIRSIEYTIRNGRDSPIYFGAPYDVQRFEGGKWTSVEWMKDLVWIMILYSLGPGDSMTLRVYLPDDVEPGCYRLVKTVMLRDFGDELVLTATFLVRD
ncbi:MAG: hypothetical protein RMJ30_06790 [Nitrososphaerota archaeon]|nr:hypothetical protein [Nitrososphaerota archaeon]